MPDAPHSPGLDAGRVAPETSQSLEMIEDTGVLRRRVLGDGSAVDKDRAEVEARRVRLLYEQVPTTLLATTLVASVVLAMIAFSDSAQTYLARCAIWFGAVLLLAGVRYWHAQTVLAPRHRRDPVREERVSAASAGLGGIIWSLVTLVAPTELTPVGLVPAVVMLGMLAGATVAYAASPLTYVCYAVPVTLGLVVALVQRGGDYVAGLVALALIFVGVMSMYLLRINKALRQSLSLRSENRELLLDVSRKNRRLQTLNESLERTVGERTQELRGVNAKLRKDIDAKLRAERALKQSEMRFRALYDDSPAMTFMLSPSGQVVSVNACGAQELGLDSDAIIGKPWSEFVFAPFRDASARRMRACLEAPGTASYADLQVLRGDGSTLWLRVAMRALRAFDGSLELLVSCQDVTDARVLAEQLGYHASHDTLTGLVNRRAFEERVQRVVRTSGAQGSEHAICYLDLDHFKRVNDEGGHAAGDELLRQLARLMRERVRRRDTLARLGGDEFGLLMEHCSIEQAMRIAESLRDAVSSFAFAWDSAEYRVGVSVGVTSLTGEVGTLDEALRRADAACYAAKEAGRNRIELFDDGVGGGTATAETPWGMVLETAMQDGRLVLLAENLRAAGEAEDASTMAELSLRYASDDGALVTLESLGVSALRHDLAVRLDLWVLERALEFLGGAGAEIDTLFVSLGERAAADRDFAQAAERLIRRNFEDHGTLGRLCISVSEAASIVSFGAVRELMRSLRATGCRFALREFGSGLSSLAQLRALPVDFVKVDGGFSRDVADNALQAAMVRSVADVGHVMNKRIVASGVRSADSVATLAGLGVDYVQGEAIDTAVRLGEWQAPEAAAT